MVIKYEQYAYYIWKLIINSYSQNGGYEVHTHIVNVVAVGNTGAATILAVRLTYN